MIHDHHERRAAYRSYDGYYIYAGANGWEGRCYLQVYEPRGGLPVALATEIAANPGSSVTNSAAGLATRVWRNLLPQAREGLRWIEVYLDPADENPVYRERFAEVEFQLAQGTDGDALHTPAWRYIDRAGVEALIGGPFSVPFTSSY